MQGHMNVKLDSSCLSVRLCLCPCVSVRMEQFGPYEMNFYKI